MSCDTVHIWHTHHNTRIRTPDSNSQSGKSLNKIEHLHIIYSSWSSAWMWNVVQVPQIVQQKSTSQLPIPFCTFTLLHMHFTVLRNTPELIPMPNAMVAIMTRKQNVVQWNISVELHIYSHVQILKIKLLLHLHMYGKKLFGSWGFILWLVFVQRVEMLQEHLLSAFQ